MSELRQAAQQALAYIEEVDYGPYDKWPVITALRKALDEPEQPVAWADDVGAVIPHSHKLFAPDLCEKYTRPLYAAPTPRKPVELTDWDIDRVTDQQWTQHNHKPIYAAHRAYARAVIAEYEAKQGEQT